jgi:hypothetical protein
MPFRPFIVLVGMGVIAAYATPAHAQGGGQRLGGLFGATRSDTADRNRLNVLFAVSEGFDSEVAPEVQSRVPNAGPQSGGYSTMLTTSADYMNTGRRLQVGGTAQSAFRYYQQLAKVSSTSHSAGLQARVQLSRTATLQMRQTAAYSPSYLFQLFPNAALPGLEEPIAPTPEYRIHETESHSYRTDVTLGAGSARGNRVSVSGDYGRTEFRRQIIERPDMETYSGRAKYSHGVGRSAGLSAEYEYRAGELGFAPFTEHRVNFGAEYSRALSTSRRATFRFKISPGMLEISESAQNGSVTGSVYRLQGDGAVDYQFSRTWRASASYHRGVDYVAVLTEPVFADSARADLSGLITRRLDVSVSAGYAVGESALTQNSSQLDSYTGTARLRFALTRALALYTEYFYYFYDLRGSSHLAPELPNTFEQHGIRAGLTLWIPVF